jgi:outer membrane protein TolC
MTNAQISGIVFKACLVLSITSYTLLFGQSAAAGAAGNNRTAESSVQSSISSPAVSAYPQQGDTSFGGSVPQGQASATPIPLSLADAITRGLKANLGLLTTQEASRQARAERVRALSALLPRVTGQINAVEQQLNLQALGFLVSPPPTAGFTIPNIVGPYSYQSVLANASMSLFDYSAISNYKASKENLKASALSVKNARDLVVQAVGDAYLQIIADGARMIAVQAEIDAVRPSIRMRCDATKRGPRSESMSYVLRWS